MAQSWRQGLSERERKEVEFATLYVRDFAHGTDGDSRLKLVAKMAGLLDAGEMEVFPYPATMDAEGFARWVGEGHQQPPSNLPIGVIVLGRASTKRGEKRYTVTYGLEDEVLPLPVPGRFLTPIASDPPMAGYDDDKGGKP